MVFRGVARRQSRGREVVHLEYEAYPQMAEKVMAQIADEMKSRWPITRVAIVHRTGVLQIGQASVVIAVSAPHRGEAFAAAQYAIDRLKQIVPIWRKRCGATARNGSAGKTRRMPKNKQRPDNCDRRVTQIVTCA